ncbi:NUDIX domain-containing protein [Nocardia abscessus]|uniref:NUDIX domain-containing protein n=1 Tax=Nocardia abscessus TaxID=120957 RepID=A0ABS0CF43_9NOCA|nr:NUDIX domain-containing protein [Nocardia abscessus]MBF6228972.1 NUDIX domain-containing protein [Nocardia abscessus]
MTRIIDKLAWIQIVDGRILSTRTRGKDTYYIPGGKREAGESDWEALRREIEEELSVKLIGSTVKPAGVYEAQAHGQTEGIAVRMTCYTAEYEGELTPASEIEELMWLDHSGRELSSPVDKIIFDALHDQGLLKSAISDDSGSPA